MVISPGGVNFLIPKTNVPGGGNFLIKRLQGRKFPKTWSSQIGHITQRSARVTESLLTS